MNARAPTSGSKIALSAALAVAVLFALPGKLQADEIEQPRQPRSGVGVGFGVLDVGRLEMSHRVLTWLYADLRAWSTLAFGGLDLSTKLAWRRSDDTHITLSVGLGYGYSAELNDTIRGPYVRAAAGILSRRESIWVTPSVGAIVPRGDLSDARTPELRVWPSVGLTFWWF